MPNPDVGRDDIKGNTKAKYFCSRNIFYNISL